MLSPGLLIGIPTRSEKTLVPLSWAWSFRAMVPPINTNLVVSQIQGMEVAAARNELAKQAIESKSDFIFFIGDDVVAPHHTLKQLLFRMQNDPKLGVCGGVYCSKCDPPAPLVFRQDGHGSFWDWKVGEYFEVTGLGMDCTMIRTEVFKQISQPWFKTVDSNKFLDNVNEADYWTEDLYFLKKVRTETDYKIFCDASVIAEHWDINTQKKYTLPIYSLPLRRFKTDGTKKIIDIGCGPTKREFEEGIPVRVDIREECEPDYRCDVRLLPFGNEEFDIVYSSHCLEHFKRNEWENVLLEWLRLLKKDGELRLVLPNILWSADCLMKGIINNDVLNVLYGAQSNPFDIHYNGFTPDVIGGFLKSKGINSVITFEGYNMIIKGRYKGNESIVL